MNKFELSFFEKYIPEWQEILWMIHIHFIEIINKIFLWLSMWAIFPSLLYYYSDRLKTLVPFYYLEWFLIIIFIKIVYEIFNWYNDVWIITNTWVIWLQWALFKTTTESVTFEKMEWLEVVQWWFNDKLLKKWDLIIHKFWDDNLVLINAMNPYKWVNLIEELSKNAQDLIDSYEDDKFNLIMNALWWVVENYLWNKTDITDEDEKLIEFISEIKNTDWTIDLRQ